MEEKELKELKLKAEIFDILATQDFYRIKINELDQLKQQKIKELQDVRNSVAESIEEKKE